jgi:carbonic anhydrase
MMRLPKEKQLPDPLLTQSKRGRDNYIAEQKPRLNKLAREGQVPQALFITCSDSRIMPEHLLDARPGDFFMLRNVANIVPPYYQTEIGIVSVLEFAVLDLAVPHIIVCGHTDCGGIKALDKTIDMSRQPALSRWLDLARPSQRDVDFSLQTITDAERHLAIVERHVIYQLQNIQSYPFIREKLENDQLALHGWIYHLETQHLSVYEPNSAQFVNF